MQKNILITGQPKSGKSTLLRKLIAAIDDKVGFVANEVLVDGQRVGFEVETSSGQKAPLADINFPTAHKVAKYYVNVDGLESVLPGVSDFQPETLLYLDEIGEMQLFSEKFKDLVLAYLNAENTCLATISSVYENDFTKSLKERDDSILVEITAENRSEQELFLAQLLKKIAKAKIYASQPDRLTLQGARAELRSEHGSRTLTHNGKKWSCDCDFHARYGICSHAIAFKELVKSNPLRNIKDRT